MQQQQFSDFDLLAAFSNESKAEAAETKLHKEGFSEEEVFRLAADVIANGQFREHGPNRDRSSVFLQTRRSGPSPTIVVLLAVIFGLVLGGLALLAHFAFPVIPLLTGRSGRCGGGCYSWRNHRAAEARSRAWSHRTRYVEGQYSQ